MVVNIFIIGLLALLCIGTRPLIIADGTSLTDQDGRSTRLRAKNVSVILLAAELAHIAAKLADAADADGSFTLRHTRARRKPNAGHRKQQHQIDVDTRQVVSTPVDFKGHKLSVVTLRNDEYVGGTIRATKQPFQGELLGLLMDFITPGSTVIDAGANMGMFSMFFAAQTGPAGAVYSFEPQARMFQVLCTNMVINSLMHMWPLNKALSYKPGVLQMSSTLPDGTNGGKSYKDIDAAGTALNYGGMRLGVGGEEVQVITLDSLNLKNVSVMKVDVQGAERLMFFGAQDTIKRNMPIIAFESSGSHWEKGVEKDLKVPDDVLKFDIMAFLTGLGYSAPPQYQLSGALYAEDRVMVPPNHPMLAKGVRNRLS